MHLKSAVLNANTAGRILVRFGPEQITSQPAPIEHQRRSADHQRRPQGWAGGGLRPLSLRVLLSPLPQLPTIFVTDTNCHHPFGRGGEMQSPDLREQNAKNATNEMTNAPQKMQYRGGLYTVRPFTEGLVKWGSVDRRTVHCGTYKGVCISRACTHAIAHGGTVSWGIACLGSVGRDCTQ